MKIKSLSNNGKFIMLSGEIDKNYTVPPGIKITFGEDSTFEGIKLASGVTFCNNESVVKHFTINKLGKVELAPVSDLPGEDVSAKIEKSKKSLALIPSFSYHPSEHEEDSSLELGIPNLTRERPSAPTVEKELWEDVEVNENGASKLAGENINEEFCDGCCAIL